MSLTRGRLNPSRLMWIHASDTRTSIPHIRIDEREALVLRRSHRVESESGLDVFCDRAIPEFPKTFIEYPSLSLLIS
jgi:hypothetical protein